MFPFDPHTMEICPLTNADLNSVAHVHALAFPDAALTRFGMEAIKRYYSWQKDGPHESICIGAFSNTQLAGFCFGGVFRNAETGFLKKNGAYLLWHFVTHPWLFTYANVRDRVRGMMPSFRINFVRSKNVSLLTQSVTKKFGILSIAVHPQYQGLGVGKLLMLDIEASARQMGFSMMRLTVHPTNLKAISFYEKLGWQKISAIGNEWEGYMTKDLEDSN